MQSCISIVKIVPLLGVFVLLLLSLAYSTAPVVYAAGQTFTVQPLVFDEKAQIRDIIKRELTVTNNTNHRVSAYVFVNNIDELEGEQEPGSRATANISESLAHWIEITRGVIELDPGQTRQIPFLIHVSVYAEPGVHHAQMGIGWGSTKIDAKERAEKEPKILVNVEVEDDSKEVLQLSSFIPDKTFFLDSIASFSYLFENIGNRTLSPKGEIRIYNRRGEEVGAVPVNGGETELLPNKTSQLDSMWESEGTFGRYKAILDVEYGNKQRGTVQDTIFFWIVPWKKILTIFLFMSIVLVIVVYLLHRRYELYHQNDVQPVPVRAPGSTDPKAAVVPQAMDESLHPRRVVVPQTLQTARTSVSSNGGQSDTVTLQKRTPAPHVQGHVVQLKKRT